MEVICAEQIKEKKFENPPEIGSKGNDNANISSQEIKDRAPTVLPGAQTLKSESQGSGKQVVNCGADTPTSYRRRGPDMFVESPDWLPPGWLTGAKVRKRGITAGGIDKYYYDPFKRHPFRSKKEVFQFLATRELIKRRPKMKLEGEIREETKSASKIYSSAWHSSEISPYIPTSALFLPPPSSSMSSPITNGFDLPVQNNHINPFPSYASPMVTFISHSEVVNNESIQNDTHISSLHDQAISQNIVDSYTIPMGSSDFFFHNHPNAPFLSHQPPMDAIIHPLGVVNNISMPIVESVSHFYDSTASHCTNDSHFVRRQSFGNSNFLFDNDHVAPLTPYPPPIFEFIPELGVSNNMRIQTTTPISHIHHSESAINSNTIGRPKKFQRVYDGLREYFVPIFNEDRVPIFTQKNQHW